jgi:predicted amidophosphoribosyltransferase
MMNDQGHPLCWGCRKEIGRADLRCSRCQRVLDPKERIGLDQERCGLCESNLCDGVCINGCQTRDMGEK